MADPVKIYIVQNGHVESVWATPISDDHYKIGNIPFEIYNISLGDTVVATTQGDDASLHFQQLHDKSGNRTLQLRLSNGMSSPAGVKTLEILKRAGATYEAYAENVLAVNVLPDVDIYELRLDLDELSDEGVSHQTLDPSDDVDVPVGDGSPAQSKIEREKDDLRKRFNDFMNS